MDISIFLARFFGIYLFIAGLLHFTRREFIRKAADQIFESEGLVVTTAILSLIIGLLVVLSHNVWVFNWRVTITIIGYMGLLKGVLRLFVPRMSDQKLFKKMLRGDNPIYIGIISWIIGFFLIYEGFFAA